MYVFVLNDDGSRLMPTHAANARKLLKAGKAKVASRNPFAIRLNYHSPEHTQPVTAKLDTGFKKGGVALEANGGTVFLGEITHRKYVNQPTKGHAMVIRRQRRRLRRYRLRYRAPRFDNRRRPEGWLPPIIKAKVDAQINVLKVLAKYAPITRAIIEVCGFDTHKMQNADIKSEDYQNGRWKGHKNHKAYVRARDKACVSCGRPIKEIHHLRRKVKGGTDNPDNLVGLCEDCHDLVTLGDLALERRPGRDMRGAAFINAAKDYIASRVRAFVPDVRTQEGWWTKRERWNLSKSHVNDATAMGTAHLSALHIPPRLRPVEIRPRQRVVRQQYLSEPGKGGVFKRYHHPWRSTAGIRRGDLCRDTKTGWLLMVDTLLSTGRLNARVLRTGQRLVKVNPDQLHIVERAKAVFIPKKRRSEPALLP